MCICNNKNNKNMINKTLETFDKWNEVSDYESDKTTVSLLNDKGEIIAEYNYSEFTKTDFDYFLNKFKK